MPIKEKKVLTPEEKFKLELQTETQLLRFQRQYHILEKDSSRFTGGSGALSKQRKVINILKREYNEILTDLDVAGSESNARKDATVAEYLTRLLEQYNNFVVDIKREKSYLQELDMQITMAKKSIVKLKESLVTDIQCTQRIREGERTLEGLENKLDVATKRFCMTLAENRKLREEIDHLLKERAHFNKLWDKLITNLAKGKKFMLDLIEQATIAYDQREEWCQKLQSLRARANTEFTTQSHEMTEMQREIDNETKLQEFLDTKGQRRVMLNLLEKEKKKREQQKLDMEAALANYTEMLENIKEFMNETSLFKVADKFSVTEMENFSLFSYVIELNKDMELLSDELMHLQMGIDEQKKLHEFREHQQEARLKKLEGNRDAKKAEMEAAENDLAKSRETLNELLEGIDKVFKQCRCSEAPLLELLGDNSHINMHNAMLYLQILEKKINDILMSVYYKEHAKGRKKKQLVPTVIKNDKVYHHNLQISELVKKDPCPLCVEQAMVSDVIDSLQKVMNKQQIIEKLEEAIEKRGFNDVVHNVSRCHLPKSRAIIQKRYQ